MARFPERPDQRLGRCIFGPGPAGLEAGDDLGGEQPVPLECNADKDFSSFACLQTRSHDGGAVDERPPSAPTLFGLGLDFEPLADEAPLLPQKLLRWTGTASSGTQRTRRQTASQILFETAHWLRRGWLFAHH